MKRILWLIAVATLILVSAGVKATPGTMPIGDEKRYTSADCR